MALLTGVLPPPSTFSSIGSQYDHSKDPWFKNRYDNAELKVSQASETSHKPVPPYTRRSGFRPSKPEDFGDGGAFPEINYAQYPLGMGRNTANQKPGTNTLPLTVDERGDVRFDAIVKQDENAKKIVYSKHSELVPIFVKDNVSKEVVKEADEREKEIEATMMETRAALEKIVNIRLSVSQPKNVPTQSSKPQYIRYKPSEQSAAFNSGAKERIIRVMEMPVDPLDPAKFKHKKVPRGNGSPPVPVLSSPPRPLTKKHHEDWKIPPCISNWKNPKGYTIPVDKRLASDGRGLTDVKVNDMHAFFIEALYLAEQRCREEVELRAKVLTEMVQKEKERKEKELIELARKARSDRTGFAPDDDGMEGEQNETKEERAERLKRDAILEERRKDRERERRMEARDVPMSKKSKITRDKERDISEKVALGLVNIKGGGEVTYDQRLFNQDRGMDSSFANDDSYNIYDKRLFNTQSTLNTLYRPKKDRDDETYGGSSEQQLDELIKPDRFKPERAFSGTSKTGARDGPVEFERNGKAEEEDIFGLDKFLTEVKTGKKAMEKVGSRGTLKASAGSMLDGFEGSGRSRVNFQRGH